MNHEDLPTGFHAVPLAAGRRLGTRYEILREIGRGGMGIVYLAKDIDLDLEVVLKVLPPELSTNRRAMEDLKREASVAIRLSHPNIVRVYTTDEIEGTRFVAMEYVDGETLAARLDREGPLSEEAFLRVAIPVCEALAYAHANKVIHRDLKPANIMLVSGQQSAVSGQIKVMDFGIARVVKDSTTWLTGKVMAGTLLYMSPEQVLGRKVDERSDIYSLGATFYELLTGDPPFTQGDITYQILNEIPKPLRETRAQISVDVESAVMKCLAKPPEQRYRNPAELKAVLKHHIPPSSEVANGIPGEARDGGAGLLPTRASGVGLAIPSVPSASQVTDRDIAQDRAQDLLVPRTDRLPFIGKLIAVNFMTFLSMWPIPIVIEYTTKNVYRLSGFLAACLGTVLVSLLVGIGQACVLWKYRISIRRWTLLTILGLAPISVVSLYFVYLPFQSTRSEAFETYSLFLFLAGLPVCLGVAHTIALWRMISRPMVQLWTTILGGLLALFLSLLLPSYQIEMPEPPGRVGFHVALAGTIWAVFQGGALCFQSVRSDYYSPPPSTFSLEWKGVGGRENVPRQGRWIAVGGVLLLFLLATGWVVKTRLDSAEREKWEEAERKAGELEMQTVLVPAGDFWMGCNASVDNECPDYEKPYHQVYLDAFSIDRTEVTVGAYARCVQAGSCSAPGMDAYCNWNASGHENHPINCVDWNQANAYCQRAGKRLPTEAEWEKAARGTDGRIYPWGNAGVSGSRLNFCDRNCSFDLLKDKNVDDGNGETAPVGSYPSGASPYGALDMAGNVSEWVSDWFGDKYSFSPSRNPQGPWWGKDRLARGASWDSSTRDARSSVRIPNNPAFRFTSVGFRCASTPP